MSQLIVVCLVLEVKCTTRKNLSVCVLMRRSGGLVRSVSNVMCLNISMGRSVKAVQLDKLII